MLTNSVQFILGCDGSSCQNPDEQRAYSLDDMPDIHFCKTCWTQEMNRRKKHGETILVFPERSNVAPTSMPVRYRGFTGREECFVKFEKRQRLEE